jgi:hypothetical protein
MVNRCNLFALQLTLFYVFLFIFKMSQQSAPEETSTPQQMERQAASVPVVQTQAASQSVAPHLLGFLSNPTLAAAASSAPLFPGITMLNNPEALIGMPGMYRGHHMMQPGINISSNANTLVDCQGNGFSQSTQSQLTQQQPPQYLQQILPNHQQQQLLAPSTVNAQQMMSQNYAFQVPIPSTLGGVSIPPVPPHSSTAVQVQIAAAAAAVAAAPLKGSQSGASQRNDEKNKQEKAELTPQEKARQNRDRNREHARSTRLRKKAYVQKLKELVEGLHVQRTEEVRKRRVAIQHLSELQSVRRAVVRSFLHFHASNESDERKWSTILEENVWLRQPVTPYRSFRRAEVEQECRVSRGIESIISDSASLSVMVEGVGSRSSRWMQLKREEVLRREGMRSRYSQMPYSIGEDSQQQTGVSSLSSSSGSSNGSGEEEERQKASIATQLQKKHKVECTNSNDEKKKVSSSSGSSHEERSTQLQGSNDFHVYNAPELPDPMLGDSEGSSPSDSPEELNVGQSQRINQHTCTDSSSGEEEKLCNQKVDVPPSKRRKFDNDQEKNDSSLQMSSDSGSSNTALERNSLPANISPKGGISHNIKTNFTNQKRNGNGRLKLAPAIPLPPFVGIGKKAKICTAGVSSTSQDLNHTSKLSSSNMIATPQERLSSENPFGPTTVSSSSTHNVTTTAIRADLAPSSYTATNVILPDSGDSSSQSSSNKLKIRAYYHVNEDDMLLTDDILMCPFVFRTQGAVMCGALSECVMPGMLRCHFSQLNKLLSIEMVYDAMGFMQQLERACGSDNLAQVVPGSLEMALAPNSHEARIITLAKHPFLIVSVNEAWTKVTKYSQMEVEGKCLSILNSPGSNSNQANHFGKSIHNFDDVAKGKSKCSTNIHYDKEGKLLVDLVCSYPLTK